MIKYTEEKKEILRYKFPGIDEVNVNYSQAYQDIFVLTCLDGKKYGSYLEIGAYHSTSLSNTYLLENKFGWTGLSLDIDDRVRYSFDMERKNPLLIADALSLDYKDILEKYNMPKIIDYLQLDIEPQNNTLECLKKIPFGEYEFKVITYETDFYDPSFSKEESLRNREESRKTLKENGYFLLAGNVCNVSENDPFEDWYINPKYVSMDIVNILKESEECNMVSEKILTK